MEKSHTIHDILSTEDKITRIDKKIPTGLTKIQLKQLFRGHQITETISFYVKSSLSEEQQIQICDNELTSLFQSPPSKQNVFDDIPESIKEIKKSNISKTKSSQFISLISPGYISSKYLRCQLLHSFLIDLYPNKFFTIDDILTSMPADLYFKIIGTNSIPTIFKIYPLFRFIQMDQFPDHVLQLLDFADSYKIMQNLLDKLEKDFHLIKKNYNQNSYQLIQSMILSFGVEYNFFKISINFFNQDDLLIFWRFILISNRIENNDTHSSILWYKRWSIKDYFMNVKNNSLMSIIFQHDPCHYCLSNRKYDEYVDKYGFELLYIMHYIDKTKMCSDDLLIKQFCHSFEWENPNIITQFYHLINKYQNHHINHVQQIDDRNSNPMKANNLIISNNHLNKHQSNLFNKLSNSVDKHNQSTEISNSIEQHSHFLRTSNSIDKTTQSNCNHDNLSNSFDDLTDNSIEAVDSTDCKLMKNDKLYCSINFQDLINQFDMPKNIKDLIENDENLLFTFIVAKSKITLNGIIHNSDIQWKSISEFLNNPNWKEIRTKFYFLIRNYEIIQSFYDYQLSSTIENCYSQTDNYFELTQTELLSHFNITNLQLNIKAEIGELVESFKIFLNCNSMYYSQSNGLRLLCEYKYENFYDSLFDLKLLGILNPKHENKSKPKLYQQFNKILIKDQFFFENVKTIIQTNSSLYANYQREFIYLILMNNQNLKFKINAFDCLIKKSILDLPKLPNFEMNYKINDNENDSFKPFFENNSLKAFIDIDINQSKSFKTDSLNLFDNQINNSLNNENQLNYSFEKENQLKIFFNKENELNSFDNKKINFENKFSLLNEAISQLSLIEIQLNQIRNTPFSPFIIYGYCYVFFSRYDGLSLDELCKILDISYDSSAFDSLVNSISFLEEFHFLIRKNGSSALPRYICDIFTENSIQKHYWMTMDGEIDIEILNKQICYVHDQIELNPGIELSKLYSLISYLSIHDLLDIIQLLICDEAIYMTTSIKDENSLFESDVFLPLKEFSHEHLSILLYLRQIDPTCNIPIICLYPTDRILTLY